MIKYWAIAPYERRYITQWENVWRWNLQNGHITLGWGIGRDPSRLSKEALLKAVRKHKADRSQRSQEIIHRMIWNFYHEIKQGHIVIARRGLSEVAAIGTVRKTAYFDLKKSRTMPSEEQFENFLDVDWHDEPRDLIFNSQIFSQPTVLPISEEKYVSLFTFPTSKSFTDEEEKDFPEGKESYRYHKYRERNQKVIRLAKAQRIITDPLLKCDVCEFSFQERYGQVGIDYIEAHHCIPLSESKTVVKTRVSDFALVCSNCHRMLHRHRPWLEIKDIRSLVKRKKHNKRLHTVRQGRSSEKAKRSPSPGGR